MEVDEEAWNLGVLPEEDLEGLKARMLLIVALAETRDLETLQSYFRRLSGDVSE